MFLDDATDSCSDFIPGHDIKKYWGNFISARKRFLARILNAISFTSNLILISDIIGHNNGMLSPS